MKKFNILKIKIFKLKNMDDSKITKLNWKRIVDEIPEVHDILAYGDMSWVK